MKDYSMQLAQAAHFPNQIPKPPAVPFGTSGNRPMVGGQRQKTRRSIKGRKPGSKSPPNYNADADQG